MGNPQAEKLLADILRYINKVLNDPSVVTKSPSEFRSAIATAVRLSQLMPAAPQFAAVPFERFIRDLVSNPTLREAVKAQLQASPSTMPSSGSQTEMMRQQQEMEKYTMMMETLSNVMQNMSDVQKSVIRNIR